MITTDHPLRAHPQPPAPRRHSHVRVAVWATARMLLCCVLMFGAPAWPFVPVDAQQIVGPLQVSIVGDTLADEGARVSYSLFPWSDREIDAGAVYTWDLGDGSPQVRRAENTAVGHRFMRPGTYTVTATDGAGTTFLTVEVRPVAPTIDVVSYDWPRKPGDASHFQALAWDPGQGALTYTWDFGDGSPPRSGVALSEVSHSYTATGIYPVTLVVRDANGLEATARMTTQSNPGFYGQLSGDLSRPVAGTSGKASLMNVLPGSRAIPSGLLTLFTGAVPLAGGAADLSEAFGVCFINAGFWDEASKLHINFLWTADSERILELPRSFPVQWNRPAGEGEMPRDQMIVNTLVLDIDPSYEDTKRGADTHQVFDPGAVGLLGDLQGMLSAMFGAGGGTRPSANPGRNWQLTSLQQAGQVTISSVTPERITGWMDVQLGGAWISFLPEANGRSRSMNLQGAFRWELDDDARANLLRCGQRQLEVVSHTPDVEAEMVDYERPGVSVTFNLPVDRTSVHHDSLALGYLDASGGFRQVTSRIVHTTDPRVVRIVPDEPLYDAVYHVVRVRGGQGGVRTDLADVMAADYEWRFSTMPELVAYPKDLR